MRVGVGVNFFSTTYMGRLPHCLFILFLQRVRWRIESLIWKLPWTQVLGMFQFPDGWQEEHEDEEGCQEQEQNQQQERGNVHCN